MDVGICQPNTPIIAEFPTRYCAAATKALYIAVMPAARKYGSVFFFAALVIHCCAIYYGMDELRFITKMLLAPLLIVILLLSHASVSILTYLALAGCFAGDILLSQAGDKFFLIGMLAFMLAHVFNGVYFFRLQGAHHSRMREPVIVGVLLIFVSVIVFVVLNPYLGQLRLPIVVYMVLISVMAILAACTAGMPPYRKISHGYFIPGAISFVVSDSLLALNKFIFHLQWLDTIVMFTYGMALYLIAMGALRLSLQAAPAEGN